MQDNTDLRILEKRAKLFKCLVILFSILTPFPLLGVGLKYPYSYFFIALCGVFLTAAITCAVFMHITDNKIKKTLDYLRDYRDNLVLANNAISGYLTAAYANLNCKECGDLGYVYFARENLAFSAEGVFVVQKDFKGVKGNHLAVQIRGTQLVSAPENYDDVLDYESNLFTLNIGYFEDCPLTEENDTGLILPEGDFTDKAIGFSSSGGYVCSLDTAETDDIDRGELVILESTEDSLLIGFKCMVEFGAADVIYGRVKLAREPQILS